MGSFTPPAILGVILIRFVSIMQQYPASSSIMCDTWLFLLNLARGPTSTVRLLNASPNVQLATHSQQQTC